VVYCALSLATGSIWGRPAWGVWWVWDARLTLTALLCALFVGYQRDTPVLHLTADGVCSDHVHWFLERFDQAYVDELRAFVQCIVDGTAPSVTGAGEWACPM